MITYLHLPQYRRPIVRDCDVSIRRYQDFIEAAWAEGGFDQRGDGAGGEDVGFDGFGAGGAGLAALVADDDEGAAGFVFGYLGYIICQSGCC